MLLLSFLRIFSERIAWKLNGMDWIKVNKHASTQTLFAHNNNKSIIRLCTTKPMYERAAATIIITKLSAVSWHCVEVADFHPNSQHTHTYMCEWQYWIRKQLHTDQQVQCERNKFQTCTTLSDFELFEILNRHFCEMKAIFGLEQCQ